MGAVARRRLALRPGADAVARTPGRRRGRHSRPFAAAGGMNNSRMAVGRWVLVHLPRGFPAAAAAAAVAEVAEVACPRGKVYSPGAAASRRLYQGRRSRERCQWAGEASKMGDRACLACTVAAEFAEVQEMTSFLPRPVPVVLGHMVGCEAVNRAKPRRLGLCRVRRLAGEGFFRGGRWARGPWVRRGCRPLGRKIVVAVAAGEAERMAEVGGVGSAAAVAVARRWSWVGKMVERQAFAMFQLQGGMSSGSCGSC